MTEWKMRQTDGHVYFVSGPFSQWHPSPFQAALPRLVSQEGKPSIEPGATLHAFSHAEQAMMASKAAIFGDEAVLRQILTASSPKRQKELGRSVANFDSSIWSAQSFRIVAVMNYHKFCQNPDLRNALLDTGDRHLVEGAWYDKIWGVGLAWNDPAIEDERNWQGTNWLGEALMAVREVIRRQGPAIAPWIENTFISSAPRPDAA